MVRTAGGARDTVTAEGFDPRAEVVVQTDPRLGPPSDGSAPPAAVDVVESGRQTLTMDIAAPAAGLVLVRVPWDPHWSATVDGREVEPLKADGFLMAVPVRAGSHLVRLAYADASVGLGVLASFLVLGAIGGGALFLRARDRRRRSRQQAPAPQVNAGDQSDSAGGNGGGLGASGRSPAAKR
jgi:hypothetical protein